MRNKEIIDEILRVGLAIYGKERLGDFLTTKIPKLDNQTPLQLVRDDRALDVLVLLSETREA